MVVYCYLYNYLQAWGNHYNRLDVSNSELLVLQRGTDKIDNGFRTLIIITEY